MESERKSWEKQKNKKRESNHAYVFQGLSFSTIMVKHVDKRYIAVTFPLSTRQRARLKSSMRNTRHTQGPGSLVHYRHRWVGSCCSLHVRWRPLTRTTSPKSLTRQCRNVRPGSLVHDGWCAMRVSDRAASHPAHKSRHAGGAARPGRRRQKLVRTFFTVEGQGDRWTVQSFSPDENEQFSLSFRIQGS